MVHIIQDLRLIALASSLFQVAVSGIRHNDQRRQTDSSVITADTANLRTWRHSTGIANTKTPAADEAVRQSHAYAVQVSVGKDETFYDSFAFETIPRSGNGKLCFPDKPDICDEDDQISIEPGIGVTMAWSQFLYQSDANSLFINVPYTPETNGARLSVEFADDMFEYRTKELTVQSHYVQNVNEAAENYISAYTEDMPIVGREALNALLIFASPFPDDSYVPSSQDDIYNVKSGLVQDLSNVEQSIVSFGPVSTGSNRAILSPSVKWVYLAPGAYVKGAIEYNNGQSPLKATGFGVLTGEQYVYQANTAEGYSNSKSDGTSLKMWRGNNVTAEQSWTIYGITMSAPPFNGMDFYDASGNAPPDGFSVDVTDYKPVGGFYSQTDGLDMYTNGRLRDVFYHTGDDSIKAYYSGVVAERLIVWKTDNAPIIQIGWYPRNVEYIHISQLDVIHSRYYSFIDYAPRALIGSAASYENTSRTDTADTKTTIANFTISNIRAEGISSGLIILNMLSNIDGFQIDGAWIEELSPVPQLGTSKVVGLTDEGNGNQKVSPGSATNDKNSVGLAIKGYFVGNTAISFEANSWDATSTGRLDVDPEYWGKWTVD